MIAVLDVGGSSVKAGCVDGRRPVGEITSTALDRDADRHVLLDRFAAAARTLPETERLALAFPEPFDYERGVSWMTHKFAALHGVAVADELAARLPHHPTVRCCNDAAAAVVGEAVAGAGVGHRRVLGLTLGTGLGAALVVDGRPVREEAGIVVGDLYARLLPDGRPADEALSARGYVADVTGGSAPPAAYGRALGRFLAPVADAVRADVIVLGGGGTASFPAFGPAVADELDVAVVVAGLGRWAPIVGGAVICFG